MKQSKLITVPIKAKSSKKHPEVHLAYITDKEQDLLIKKDLYGSLKGKPNRGPGGLPSLEGDFGPGGTGSYEPAGKDVSSHKATGEGGQKYTKTKTTNGTGDGTKTTVKTDKPRFVPSIAYNVWKGVKDWGDKKNLEKRTKFARDEGLTRDWAKTHQYSKTPTLDVMSTEGKDYLKEAGYGPFQDKPPTGGGGEGQQRCPDGSMPPCPPTATAAPTSTSTSTPTNTSWQFYPTNSNYLTGEGYDEGGGVKFGPPPKKGPNPQVPPIKFSRGGGAAIRGTKFSGVK